jgi:hypothetical protein
MPHPFLSDEWLAAVGELFAEADTGGVMPRDVQINMVVTGDPGADRELHVADGSLCAGLAEGYPTKVTMPYAVAKNNVCQRRSSCGDAGIHERPDQGRG